MRHLQSFDWFQSHFGSVDQPLVHFGQDFALDESAVRVSARELGFAYLVVQCRWIRAEDDLFDAFGRDLGFPAYFGHNWNAVADCLRDWSWIPAKGYVLTLLQCGQLGTLPAPALDAFTTTIETVIAEWRDERGEWGERNRPIPFHWFLSSGSEDASWLRTRTREPYCVHSGDGSAHVTFATAALRRTEAFAPLKSCSGNDSRFRAS